MLTTAGGKRDLISSPKNVWQRKLHIVPYTHHHRLACRKFTCTYAEDTDIFEEIQNPKMRVSSEEYQNSKHVMNELQWTPALSAIPHCCSFRRGEAAHARRNKFSCAHTSTIQLSSHGPKTTDPFKHIEKTINLTKSAHNRSSASSQVFLVVPFCQDLFV